MMLDVERRWERTDDGGWRALPGPTGVYLTVGPDGRITLHPVVKYALGVGEARWLALRLAEAAAIAETLDPPSSFYEAKRRYFGLDEERNVPQ